MCKEQQLLEITPSKKSAANSKASSQKSNPFVKHKDTSEDEVVDKKFTKFSSAKAEIKEEKRAANTPFENLRDSDSHSPSPGKREK